MLGDSLSVIRNPCWTIKSMPEYQDVLTTASQLSVTDRLRLIDDLAGRQYLTTSRLTFLRNG